MAREAADPAGATGPGGIRTAGPRRPAPARAAETARPSDRTTACPPPGPAPWPVTGAWGPSPDGRGFPASAPVAQPVERPPRKRKVAGSCPARGSKRFMA